MLIIAPLLATLTLALPSQAVATDIPFPSSNALAEGVSPDALNRLDELVERLVADNAVVGAELLVIVNGKSIHHEAYGLRDKAAEEPMETGSVFCVRSMTKPTIGTSILMLVDDKQLKLGDRISKYLPAYDVEGSRDITVEHLLTHTSGLPLTMIKRADFLTLGDIRSVADLGGGYELPFEPGGGFKYSDQGTDTLTALIEVVSGMPAAEFVQSRVLDPLGMHESACVMNEGNPLRHRTCTKYAGSKNNWTRFWGPDEEPLFPFFLGSQGLYSTVTDYARFLNFWMRKGLAGRERLLASRYVRKALTPGPHPMKGSTAFPELNAEYGFLTQLWTKAGEVDSKGRIGKPEVVAFGHSGSDGTWAWGFPEQNAMVLYFTQSRGNITGLQLEEVLGELFLGAPFDPNQVAPPFEQYLGYYWEGEGDLYRAIVPDGDDLALEIMGKAVLPLTYMGEDRWKIRDDPSSVLQFRRDESGEVIGYDVGDHHEYRFKPSSELPSVDEITQRVASAHRVDLLETLGPLRMKGKLEIASIGLEGEFVNTYEWPNRFRYDSLAAGEFEKHAFDGETVRYTSKNSPVGPLDGPRADNLRLDSILVRLSDWRKWYPSIEVIQQLEEGNHKIILVRMGDISGHANTMFVDWETGHVVHMDSMTYIEMMGRVGQRTNFGDFRDVSGMMLPFKAEITYATNNIGVILTEILDYELGVELPEGTFDLTEEAQ